MQVTITDDFNLQKIANSGQCFRVKEFCDGTFRFITKDNVLYIKETSPHFFEISCSKEIWEHVWVTYFDLNRSYNQIRQSIPAADTYMQHAATQGAGIRILRQAPWEIMITFIISQRKSIPAIRTSVELLATKYGTAITTPHEKVYMFPTPEQLAHADCQSLADCKLGYRVPYVEDAISKILSGSIDLTKLSTLTTDELRSTLKEIRGVGDKVANCICLFAYGRTDVIPIDTWILKTMAHEYAGQNPFPSYGESAGIMQQYAFHYALSHKERFRDEKNHFLG